jgi:hypothetical protein
MLKILTFENLNASLLSLFSGSATLSPLDLKYPANCSFGIVTNFSNIVPYPSKSAKLHLHPSA